MIDTPLVAEWKAEAARKARIESLLGILQKRFAPLPAEFEQTIRECADAYQLHTWTLDAATTSDLAQFRLVTGL